MVGARTVYETLLRIRDLDRQKPDYLKLFLPDARLLVSPNDYCREACTHCIADSKPQGTSLNYSRLSSLDSEFFTPFKHVDYGRRGDPLLYDSNGHDLADVVCLFAGKGIKDQSFALTLSSDKPEVVQKLSECAKDIHMQTMVTVHPYLQAYNEFPQRLNKAIKEYSRFSEEIVVSLLAEPSKADALRSDFKKNESSVFEGISMKAIGDGNYIASFVNREFTFRVARIDTSVYPLGRFRKQLKKEGRLDQYLAEFGEAHYVCPDMVQWPCLVIEPDGGINLCGSFEAIESRAATVTNIYLPFAQVKSTLLSIQRDEIAWIENNIDSILSGEIQTCKMKNGICREMKPLPKPIKLCQASTK